MRRQIRPTTRCPRDFDEFWRNTLVELDDVDADLTRVRAGRDEARDLELEDISFRSLGGERLHGYFLHGGGAPRRPLVVHAHGYGSSCSVQWNWARAGVDVIGVDIRGFGRSGAALRDRSDWGYVLTGIGAPETSVLRAAVCDYLRAAQVGLAHLCPEASRTVFYGRSFGGGLALIAESVGRLADFLALGVPTFGWAEGRHFFVKDGSGREINAFLEAYPDRTEDVMLVLRYFDAVHHAGLVGCPALVGIGLRDPVVPPETVFAIANSLGGAVDIMEFPVSHTDLPEESLWSSFEARWENLALNGVARDFGRTPETFGVPVSPFGRPG
jgi:cephalosporin-C deacetylase